MSAGLVDGAKIKGSIDATLVNTLTDGQTAQVVISRQLSLTFNNGTVADKANRGLSSKTRTLAAAASETLDLYDLASLNVGAGAGQDQLGLAVTNTKIVGLLIENVGPTGDDGDLLVGGEGSGAAWNAFIKSDTAQISIPPGGFMLIGCARLLAWAVADTTSHLLKLEASGDSVTYNITWISRDA